MKVQRIRSDPITNRERDGCWNDEAFRTLIREIASLTTENETSVEGKLRITEDLFMFRRYLRLLRDDTAKQRLSSIMNDTRAPAIYVRDQNARINVSYVIMTPTLKLSLPEETLAGYKNKLKGNLKLIGTIPDQTYLDAVVLGAFKDGFKDIVLPPPDVPAEASSVFNTLVHFNLDLLAGALINYTTSTILKNSHVLGMIGIEIITVCTSGTSAITRLFGALLLYNYFKIKIGKVAPVIQKISENCFKFIKNSLELGRDLQQACDVIAQAVINLAINDINNRAAADAQLAAALGTRVIDDVSELFNKIGVDKDLVDAVKDIKVVAEAFPLAPVEVVQVPTVPPVAPAPVAAAVAAAAAAAAVAAAVAGREDEMREDEEEEEEEEVEATPNARGSKKRRWSGEKGKNGAEDEVEVEEEEEEEVEATPNARGSKKRRRSGEKGKKGAEDEDEMEQAGGAPKRTKKHTKKVKSKMLKGKSKKHLKKAKKSKKGKKTGKKVRFHSASKKSKKNTRKRR